MLVSIIIPYYNNKTTINDAVQSALSQSYAQTEIIIVDDGSSEKAKDFISTEIKQLNNIKIVYQNNQGPSSARNTGFLNSSEYLVFLDADDILAESYVQECIMVYSKNASLNIVYSKAQFFEREKAIWNLPSYRLQTFMLSNCIPVFAMIKSDVFRAVKMFDENLRYQEDWDLWLRIIGYFNFEDIVYCIPKPLCFYRKREDKNSLTDINEEQGKEIAIANTFSIIYKNYSIFKAAGFDFKSLMQNDYLVYKQKYMNMRKKYYNIWYKKIFYKFKGEKPWEDVD